MNPHDPLAPPSSAVTAPSAQTPTAQRVAQSRERLRQAMLRPGGGPRSDRGDDAGSEGEPSGGGWLSGLRSHPIASLALGALDAWWRAHPLHAGATLTQGLVSPWVRRHPIATVVGAMVVGGLMVRTRPWRWLAKRALLTGIASYMLRNALRHVPMGSLLGMLSSWGASPARSAAQPASARPRTEPRPPASPLH